MKLSIILSFIAVAQALLASQPAAMSWSDLAQSVEPDWTIRVVLPDGTAVEGKPARFEPDGLSMRVVHTSNKSLHPKGEITIPRAQVRVIGIRRNGHKGRLIGTLVPVAAGIAMIVGGLASANADEYCWIGCEGVLVAGGGLIVAAGGGTAGYFIGRSSDRRFQTVNVTAP